MSSPYKLFAKGSSKSLQKECANYGNIAQDPEKAAAKKQAKAQEAAAATEQSEKDEKGPNLLQRMKQSISPKVSGMPYKGAKPVAGVNRNPVKKLGMFETPSPNKFISKKKKDKLKKFAGFLVGGPAGASMASAFSYKKQK